MNKSEVKAEIAQTTLMKNAFGCFIQGRGEFCHACVRNADELAELIVEDLIANAHQYVRAHPPTEQGRDSISHEIAAGRIVVIEVE